MKTTIGGFDPQSKTVDVTFEHAGVTHSRAVNACLTARGKYDAKATAARVEEVAAGVAVKIEAGVITSTESKTPMPSEQS